MVRVALKLLLAAAALAAVWAFVPVGGRTMADRWRHARTGTEFLDRTWGELRGDARQPEHAHAPPRAQARAGAQPARPTESHTEADRQALDRILSEHVRK